MRSSKFSTLFVLIAGLVVAGCDKPVAVKADTTTTPAAPAPPAAANDFDVQITQAKEFVKAGKLDEALAAVQAAAKLDAKRYEAPASAALILLAAKRPGEAKTAIQDALRLAPEDKRAKLQEIARHIDEASAASPVAVAVTNSPTEMSGTTKRQLNLLMLILEEADKATLDAERKKLLAEFLDKSAEFVKENPKQLPVWTLRAVAAMELNQPKTGWEAGQQMSKLGADNSDDAKVQKVMAMLDRKGWLGKEAPSPLKNVSREKPFENSLGMKFVPVPGKNFLAGIWETRVHDFAAFVDATGYDASGGMYSVGTDGWKQRGDTWKSPGFDQTPQHPVCGVSFVDANKFCEWLTEKERKAGLIGDQDAYRLPTDADWSAMVGPDEFPWGNQWPPSSGAGNYADSSSDTGTKIENYYDGYKRTSPVGSFNANRLGIYDLGGNVWEWCDDWYRKDMNTEATRKEIPALDNDGGGTQYRVLRGASWSVGGRVFLSSSYRDVVSPGLRGGNFGFRCVLVVGGGVR